MKWCCVQWRQSCYQRLLRYNIERPFDGQCHDCFLYITARHPKFREKRWWTYTHVSTTIATSSYETSRKLTTTEQDQPHPTNENTILTGTSFIDSTRNISTAKPKNRNTYWRPCCITAHSWEQREEKRDSSPSQTNTLLFDWQHNTKQIRYSDTSPETRFPAFVHWHILSCIMIQHNSLENPRHTSTLVLMFSSNIHINTKTFNIQNEK